MSVESSCHAKRAASSLACDVRLAMAIPMRDGITLNAMLFLPRGCTDPLPAVIQKTPYGIDAFYPLGRRFCAAGLAFVLIDCRGRGSSGGQFEMFETDVDDLYDAIEWLHRQPWCDGRLAMHGGSYSATNQWIAAKSGHPALKGIAPWGAAYPGIDVPPGGVPFVGHLSWHVLTAGASSQWQMAADADFWMAELADAYRQNRDFAELAARFGSDSPAFLKTLRDPFYAIRQRNFLPTDEEMAAVDIPILSSTGHYDSTHGGTLHFYNEHCRLAPDAAAKHHLVIGPWHHAGMDGAGAVGGLTFGPAAAIDMGAVRIEWYRWLFGMGPWPEFLSDPVIYYMAGAEEWRGATSLDGATAGRQSWYLRSGEMGARDIFHSGFLEREALASPPDRFVSDPFDTDIIEVELTRRSLPRNEKKDSAVLYPDPVRGMHLQIAGEDPTDQAFAYNLNGQGVVYHSAPLTDDVEIAGITELSMWLTLSQPDADIVVLLSEILAEEGQSILLWSNILRLRYRNGWQEPTLAEPGVPLNANFFIPRFISRRLRKGSRLRLVIRAPASIQFQKNLHSGKLPADERTADAARCAIDIHHELGRQTELILPLAQGAT
ncbi:MAG: CocE/NonD family hydrolase [Sphingorhabdus sp.]